MAEKLAQVEANFYKLSGDGVSVNYITSGFDGKPHFTYHDSLANRVFVGDQIRSEPTEIGTLVSVVLNRVADGDSTVFSVLLPSVRLSSGHTTPVQTFGIVTLDRNTFIGPPLGQDESYTTKSLAGFAAHNVF